MKQAFYWFRNDLRLEDNVALSAAAERYETLIPIYVLDESIALQPFLGHDRMGPFRKKFLWESLEDLRTSLNEKGGGLIIAQGQLDSIFKELRDQYNTSAICCVRGLGTEEQDQESLLSAAGFQVETQLDHCLYHPEDVPFDILDTPEVFTPFRKKTEKYASVRQFKPVPSFKNALPIEPASAIPSTLRDKAEQVDDRSAFPFQGGRSAGLERLRYYLWESDLIQAYKETRNGLVGSDYSSKLSAWLSLGCISAREVYHEVQRYEQERHKNSSTYWLVFELMWRDFFQFMLMKHGSKIFLPSGIQRKKAIWNHRPEVFESWINGTTANDFINANMLEIKHTGFMSNRGRQVAASYLINDLDGDWRQGAAYFESVLVDFDAASNYGNWQYIAGVGNDPRPNRYFNPKTQAERYDPNNAFQRLWLA
jgi:deoxyribodipyrimidine photo-lyase